MSDPVERLVSQWRANAALCVGPDPGVQAAGASLECCADELELALAQQVVDLTGYTICPTGNLHRIADELDMGGSGGDAADELRKMIEVSPSLLTAPDHYNDGTGRDRDYRKQVPSGGEAVAWMLEWDGTDDPTIRTFAMAEPSRDVLPERAVVTPLYTAPPSAPVGVEGVLAEIRAAADAGGATEGKCYGWWRALAQQPAAVDGDFIKRIADSLIAKGWDLDPDCDGTGVVQLREAVISALAAQPGGSDNGR